MFLISYVGLTGSVILKSGRLSDVLLQLQELVKNVNEVEVSPNKYDSSLLAAQVLLYLVYLVHFIS